MTAAHPADTRREALVDIFEAGVRAAHGESLLAAHGRFDGRALTYARGRDRAQLDIPSEGRLVVVGAGKAAAGLGAGLEAVLGDRIDAGRLVVKYGHGAPLRRIEVLEAAHPVPDAAGEAATWRVLEMVAGLGPQDRVIVLITGGASALLVAPAEGVTLEDKQAVTELLLRSGAAIGEINAVRRRLSRVKGGGLLRAIAPARSLTLMISDIPDGNPALVGSGPTFTDPSPPGEAPAGSCGGAARKARAASPPHRGRAPRPGRQRLCAHGGGAARGTPRLCGEDRRSADDRRRSRPRP
jgi:glycerate 2-kinase